MPNRKQRRSSKTANDKKKYSLSDVQKAMSIAIEMKKITKGHLFSSQLKERCVFCGVTMKTKKECPYHIMTLLDRMQTVLVNPDFFHADNLQALWLQNDQQYQNIKLPLIVGTRDETN